jgi:hypothetical protein
MEKIIIETTGKQAEYAKTLIVEAALDSFEEYEKTLDSFVQLRTLDAGKKETILVTTVRELHMLNGLSMPFTEREVWYNLAVPNFLADRIGLEPLGHELGLEVFGQGLHHTVFPQHEYGWVICTISCNYETCRWDKTKKLSVENPFCSRAIRLEQKKSGHVNLYPTSHVARSGDRMLLLYKYKQKTDY